MLYGTSVIGLRPDRPDPSEDLLYSFAHMVALSLRRQRAEQDLRESEVLNRSLVENLPNYVLVYGPGGKILYANPASASVLGYSVEELIGTSVLSYVTEDSRDKATANLASRQNGLDLPLYEIEILTRDGGKRTVMVKGASIMYRSIRQLFLY